MRTKPSVSLTRRLLAAHPVRTLAGAAGIGTAVTLMRLPASWSPRGSPVMLVTVRSTVTSPVVCVRGFVRRMAVPFNLALWHARVHHPQHVAAAGA